MNEEKKNAAAKCPQCYGEGYYDDRKKPEDLCDFCQGTGKVTHERKLEWQVSKVFRFDNEVLESDWIKDLEEIVETGKMPLKLALAAAYSKGFEDGY